LGTREFLVIHHTDCGMLTFANEDAHRILKEATGADASSIDFMPFKDLEQSVRDDVEAIRRSEFIPGAISISGFVYDVKTGRLSQVVKQSEGA
jgi:carbonic anhydrase